MHLRNGRANQHGMKGIWVDRILYLLCDLELWLWPWILKVKYLKSSIIEIRGWIDIKGCESIGCWTQVVTSNFYLTHDLDLVFSRSNFWQPYFRNGKADWLGMKEMWVEYNIGCTMGFLLTHSAWQIDQFQPVGPWMGYSFTDLGAEGCCRSLNALFFNENI